MPFVKLNCGILDSSLWIDRVARELFITALLMAEPYEVPTSLPQLEVDSLKPTGWRVPPGWYGFVQAAGPGIIRRAGLMDDYEGALDTLRRLGEPDPESRSRTHDGRRMVRVEGGYLILNFIEYRERDQNNAQRQSRWRERQKVKQKADTITPLRNAVTPLRDVISNEAEAEYRVRTESTPAAPVFSPKKSVENSATDQRPTAYPVENRAATPERHFRVLCQLADHLLTEQSFESVGAFTDALKAACAQRRIGYDGQMIRKVIDAVSHARGAR